MVFPHRSCNAMISWQNCLMSFLLTGETETLAGSRLLSIFLLLTFLLTFSIWSACSLPPGAHSDRDRAVGGASYSLPYNFNPIHHSKKIHPNKNNLKKKVIQQVPPYCQGIYSKIPPVDAWTLGQYWTYILYKLGFFSPYIPTYDKV